MAAPVEVLQGTMTTGVTTTTVTIATALLPGDLVVLLTSRGSAGGTIAAPSGLGTWQNVMSIPGFKVDTLTGVTGGGNITLTRSTTSNANDYVVLVVRGLDVPTVDVVVRGTATSSAISTLTLQARARDNTVAVSVLTCLANPVNPAAGTDPAAGWTTYRNVASLSVASVNIATGQMVTAVTGFFATSIDSEAALLIFGTPLESRVYGEHLQTLTNGSVVPARALHEESIEALTTSATAPRALRTENVEVLSTARPPRNIIATDIEALTGPAAFAPAALRAENLEVLTGVADYRILRQEAIEVLASWVVPIDRRVITETVEVLAQWVVAIPRQLAAVNVEALTRARESQLALGYVEVLKSPTSSGPPAFIGWGIPI